jgi:hypothetical protein
MMRMKQARPRTRAQLIRSELGESMIHARRAAGHAATGMRAAGGQMAPVAERAREAATQRWSAFNEPIARSNGQSRQARRQGRRSTRWPRLFGLLIGGAALGAAAAALRRRRAAGEFAPSGAGHRTSTGLPGAGMPGAGIPEAGIPEAGMPEAGMPGAGGMRETGMPGAGGMRETGMPETAAERAKAGVRRAGGTAPEAPGAPDEWGATEPPREPGSPGPRG